MLNNEEIDTITNFFLDKHNMISYSNFLNIIENMAQGEEEDFTQKCTL